VKQQLLRTHNRRIEQRFQKQSLKEYWMSIKDILDFKEVDLAVGVAVKGMNTNELGSYELMQLANKTYFNLANTNGFDSCELAGYILLNSRKLGVSVVAEGGVASDAMKSAMDQTEAIKVYS
jgi:hypothetical protein